jgi:hypothetical protein
MVLFRATPAATRGFSLYVLILENGTHVPQLDLNPRRNDPYAAALTNTPRGQYNNIHSKLIQEIYI